MEGTDLQLNIIKTSFWLQRETTTQRGETQKWEAEDGEELHFFPTTAFPKGPDLRESLGKERQLHPCQSVGRKNIKKIVGEIKTQKKKKQKRSQLRFFSCFSGFLAFFLGASLFRSLSPSGYHISHKFQRDQVNVGKPLVVFTSSLGVRRASQSHLGCF